MNALPTKARRVVPTDIDTDAVVSTRQNEIQLVYDYSAIDNGDQLQSIARRTKRAVINTVTNAYVVGKNLGQAQEILKESGDFTEWLDVEFGMSKSTAYRMIEVSQRWETREEVPNLSPSILYLIAPDSVPDEARAEVIELSPDISYRRAESIVKAAKGADKPKKKKPSALTKVEKLLDKLNNQVDDLDDEGRAGVKARLEDLAASL